MRPRVFAIDPALRAMGWCAQGNDRRLGVVHGADPGQPALRLYEHGRWLRDHLRRRPPDVVTIEGYALGMRDSSSLVSLGELGGVLRVVCVQEGVPVAVVPPASLKLYALGKGGGKGTDKKAVVAAARAQLGYPGRDHNEADALWLWHMTMHRYTGRPPRPTGVPVGVHHNRHDEALAGAAWPELPRRQEQP